MDDDIPVSADPTFFDLGRADQEATAKLLLMENGQDADDPMLLELVIEASLAASARPTDQRQMLARYKAVTGSTDQEIGDIFGVRRQTVQSYLSGRIGTKIDKLELQWMRDELRDRIRKSELLLGFMK